MRFATPYDIVRDIQRRSQRARALDVDAALRQLGPLERWHTIGALGEPGWQSDWGPAGDPYAPPGFFLDTAGFVHLRGVLSRGTGGQPPNDFGYLFVMPQGYRPVAQYIVPAGAITNDGTPTAISFVVDRDGQVSTLATGQIGAGGTPLISFDGVNYRVT